MTALGPMSPVDHTPFSAVMIIPILAVHPIQSIKSEIEVGLFWIVLHVGVRKNFSLVSSLVA